MPRGCVAMAAFWTLIGGFRGILVALATVAACYVYNGLVDNPWVVHRARAGFVLQSKLDAANAELAERERQANAAGQAYTELQKRLAAQQQKDAADDAAQELEIAEYERRLAEAGRQCHLDEGDIEWLRQH